MPSVCPPPTDAHSPVLLGCCLVMWLEHIGGGRLTGVGTQVVNEWNSNTLGASESCLLGCSRHQWCTWESFSIMFLFPLQWCALTKKKKKKQNLKQTVYFTSHFRTQSTMMENSRQQQFEAADHNGYTTRKQRPNYSIYVLLFIHFRILRNGPLIIKTTRPFHISYYSQDDLAQA